MTTAFLTALLSNLVCAGVLAFFVYFLTRIWRNPHLAHALWLLVLVKLLTPPLVAIHVPGFLLATPEVTVEKQVRSDLQHPPAGQEHSFSSEEAVSADFSALPEPASSVGTRPRTDVREAFTLSWAQWLLAGWSLGTLIFVGIALRRHLRLLRVIAEGQSPDLAIYEDAKQIAKQMGLADCPQLRVTEVHVSPLVIGGWNKQVILLPQRLLAEFSRDQTRAVLAHELAHVRRRDHWVRWLEALAFSLHWWNPLVWWTRRQLQQAEEVCCDAWVAWALPAHRRTYGQTLLQTVEFLTEQQVLSTAAATSFGRCYLERRIEMIMNQTVPRKMSRAASAVILIIGALALPIALTQVVSADPAPSEPRQSTQADTINADKPQDLAAWARQHGGSFDGGQLTLDIYDSKSPTYGKSNLTDADFEFLKQVDPNSVRAFYMRGHEISDAGLKHIAQLTGLRILSIFGGNEISNRGLKYLAPLRQLTSLTILSNRIDDDGMEYLAAMNLGSLRKFSMPSKKITNAGLETFCEGNLTNLRSLALRRTEIDNAGLEYLKRLPALEELFLVDTDIDDRGMVYLASLPKLRKLDLRKTKITDSGLQSLQEMPNLTSLNLESTAVSDAGPAIPGLGQNPLFSRVEQC